MGIWRAGGWRGFLAGAAALFFNSTSLAVPSYISFPSDIDWKTRTSEHFEVLYAKGQSDLAIRVLNAAESAHTLLAPLFPKGPDKTYIVLGSWEDVVNGYALDLPFPHIVIYPSPPGSTSQLSALGDWLESIVLHEYVHILHIYPATGLWGVMRTVFGSWVLPNGMMPLHFHEGLAVLLETELLPGGRGEGTYFKMLQRVSVAEGKWGTDEFISRDRMDGTLTIWPHGSSPYFFGYLLNSELWKRKKDGLYRLVESYSNNWPTFFDGPLEEVYGTGYGKLWEDVADAKKKEHETTIAEIQKNPLSQLDYFTEDRSGKRNLAISPDGKKAVFRSLRPDAEAELKILELASKKVVQKLPLTQQSAEGLCWGKYKNKEFLLATHPKNQYSRNYFTLSAYWFDEERWEQLKLNKKALQHVHQMGCSQNGRRLLTYEEFGGKGAVREYVLLFGKKGPVLRETRHWNLPTGSWVSSFRVGKTHWIALRQGVNTELYRWSGDYQSKEAPTKSMGFPGHLTQIAQDRGADQADLLDAIYDADGRDEVWRIDTSRKKMIKRVAVLGGVSALAPFQDRYLVLSFRHGGYDLALADPLPEAPPREVAAEMPAPARNVASISVSEEEDYSAWGSVFPRMWIPNVLIVPNGVQFGALIPAFDVSQRHVYTAFGGYDTRGQPFVDLSYVYRFGEDYGIGGGVYYSPVFVQSIAQFYAIWGGSLRFSGYADFIDTGWSIGPVFKSVEASTFGPQKTSVGLSASLNKNIGVKMRPNAVSPHKGTTLNLSHSIYLKAMGSSDSFFLSTASIGQYIEAPWWEGHIFYLNLSGGYTEGTTLNNSFFQGGGEILFSQQRGFYLNRGFYPGQFLGRELVNFNLEYRFPLVTIERGVNYAPFFLKNIHVAFVGDATSFGKNDNPLARSRNLFDVFYYSTGVEVKSDWKAFFYMPVQFRVGAYHGFGPSGRPVYINFGVLASIL